MPRPIRRAVLRYTPEELADALGLTVDVASIRYDHQREVIDVLVCSDTLAPVEPMCEPPVVDRTPFVRPDRFRLAWASARRRAQRLASILNDGPPLTLVLHEDTETIAWEHPNTTDDSYDLRAPQGLIDSARRLHRDVTPSWPCKAHPALIHTDGPCPAQAQA